MFNWAWRWTRATPEWEKTFVACEVSRQGGWKLAVVGPKATLPAWDRVARRFGASVLFIANYEAVKLGKTGFAGFRGKDFIWQLAELINDEVHAPALVRAGCLRQLQSGR